MHVESLGKHRDVNKRSQTLPGKLDITRHSPSILYLYGRESYEEAVFIVISTV